MPDTGLFEIAPCAGGEPLRFHCRHDTDDDNVVKGVMWRDEYGNPGYEVHAGDVVLDVGAHIGAFTVTAAAAGARVFAFEPTAESFDLLRRNVAENGLDATCYNLAVSDVPGTRRFAIDKHPTCCLIPHSAADLRDVLGIVDVEAITLERAVELAGGHVDLLKMDVEGEETYILYATPPDVLAKISRIVMEWHWSVSKARLLRRHLEASGFVVDAFTHEERRRRNKARSYHRGKLFATYWRGAGAMPGGG